MGDMLALIPQQESNICSNLAWATCLQCWFELDGGFDGLSDGAFEKDGWSEGVVDGCSEIDGGSVGGVAAVYRRSHAFFRCSLSFSLCLLLLH